MDRKTVIFMAGGVIISLALFVSIAIDHPFPDYYARPEVVANEPHEAIVHEVEGVPQMPGELAQAEGAGDADGAGQAAAEPAEPALPEVEGFPNMIALESKEYEHKRPIVQFTHGLHVDKYGADCGACHHDSSGAPIEGLKKGDPVDRCISCHDQPGEPPKGKGAPELTEAEVLQFHAEALHVNCKSCHQEYNDKNNTKAAPTSCSKCHAK